MTTAIMTLGLVLAAAGPGDCPNPASCPYRNTHHHHAAQPARGGHAHGHGHNHGGGGFLHPSGGYILPPGPGDGWGFPNGDRVNAGWYSPGDRLPLGADRTADYYFPRYFSAPPEQMFMGTYYNAYVDRGQRYIPYTGAGGDHPAGGLPLDTAETPMHPYTSLDNSQPVTPAPSLGGQVDAPPLPASGGTGLTP